MMLNNSADIIDTYEQDLPDIEATVSEEVRRLRGAQAIFKESHPFPEKRKINFVQSLGFEALSTLASSFGGVVLAAVRTATIFYLSEQELLANYSSLGPTFTTVSTILPMIAMLSALFAVEGFLFATGLKVGRTKENIKGSRWGMIFALGISIVAGVVASLPLVKTLSLTSTINIVFQWILVIMTGIGATILAYFGAENLGTIFKRWELMQKDVEIEFQVAIVEWNKQAQRQYTGRLGRRLFGFENERVNRSIEKRIDGKESEVVENWLKEKNISAFQVGVGPTFIMRPSQIAEATGVKPENVRNILSRMRKGENIDGRKSETDIPGILA